MNLLRPGTRLRQQAVRARSLSSVAWTPANVTGLTYFVAGPTWCFSDSAGTVPCAAGDTVYIWRSAYGPTATMTQPTLANRGTLRQTAGGKYYVEWAATQRMYCVQTFSCLSTDRKVGCVAGQCPAAGNVLDLVAENGAKRLCYVRTDVRRIYGPTSADFRNYGAAGTATNFSNITIQAGDGSTPLWYSGGALVSQASTSGTPAEYAVTATGNNTSTAFAINLTGTASYCYGFGWRLAGAALTAAEITLLDAFQQRLYS